MTVYARPGAEGSLMSFQPRYENYIGGEWVAPAAGRYFENASPVNGQPFCEIPRSDETLGLGSIEWITDLGPAVVAFRNGPVTVIANTGSVAVELPAGTVVLASGEVSGASLPGDTTVWLVG